MQLLSTDGGAPAVEPAPREATLLDGPDRGHVEHLYKNFASLTARSSPRDVERGLRPGADRYPTKLFGGPS